MPEAISRMLALLCTLVAGYPVGMNLGLLHLRWMLARGRLLAARGAVIPGLAACGLPDRVGRLDERAAAGRLGGYRAG